MVVVSVVLGGVGGAGLCDSVLLAVLLPSTTSVDQFLLVLLEYPLDAGMDLLDVFLLLSQFLCFLSFLLVLRNDYYHRGSVVASRLFSL